MEVKKGGRLQISFTKKTDKCKLSISFNKLEDSFKGHKAVH